MTYIDVLLNLRKLDVLYVLYGAIVIENGVNGTSQN